MERGGQSTLQIWNLAGNSNEAEISDNVIRFKWVVTLYILDIYTIESL